MLNQRLQQKLLQKLSPQQILLMKLLQIPTIALEQRIKQEIEENPALEETAGNEEVDNELSANDDDIREDEKDDFDKDNEEFDLNDYLDEDEIPSYKLNANNTSPDDEQKQMPFISGTSFHELLSSQLRMRILDEKQKQIAEHIIGNIDDSGYLQRDLNSMVDDLAFTQNISTNPKEIELLLHIIQEFDPPGVGARNLQECLLIQLKKIDTKTNSVQLAILLLERYFNEFTKKHYDKILKKANISEEELKEAISEVLKLNPKPGNSLSDTSKINQYVIPDFTINNNDGELELSLNQRNAPSLKVSKDYKRMLVEYQENKKNSSKSQKDAAQFARQKLDGAKWFIDAIKQRQATLLHTMDAIMQYQKEFFLTGDETKLKPMILKDIAEIINMDISTVSRVGNSKYVQTQFGTFLLKWFFSESLTTESGEEVSSREVKRILSDAIGEEDKKRPLSDEKLAGVLKEKGYVIARRTVAKYREQLNLPVARLRKEL